MLFTCTWAGTSNHRPVSEGRSRVNRRVLLKMVMLLLWVEAMEGSKGYMRGEVEEVDVERGKGRCAGCVSGKKDQTFEVFLQIFQFFLCLVTLTRLVFSRLKTDFYLKYTFSYCRWSHWSPVCSPVPAALIFIWLPPFSSCFALVLLQVSNKPACICAGIYVSFMLI